MNQEPILRTLCTPVGCGQGRSEAKGQPEERLSSTSAVRFQTQRHVIRVSAQMPSAECTVPWGRDKSRRVRGTASSGTSGRPIFALANDGAGEGKEIL